LSADGEEKIIDIVQPGQTFAEALMFTDRSSFPVSAAALGPARVVSFDSRCFLRILCESVETRFRTMGIMSRRLRGLIKEVDDLTLQSATARLCGMLVSRMEETGSRRFHLPAAKGVLAARLSMEPETFSRISHNLSERGIIETHGDRVVVLDPEELFNLAKAGTTAGLEPEQPCQGDQD
jgi:CRP-like cAMP-binding protein